MMLPHMLPSVKLSLPSTGAATASNERDAILGATEQRDHRAVMTGTNLALASEPVSALWGH